MRCANGTATNSGRLGRRNMRHGKRPGSASNTGAGGRLLVDTSAVASATRRSRRINSTGNELTGRRQWRREHRTASDRGTGQRVGAGPGADSSTRSAGRSQKPDRCAATSARDATRDNPSSERRNQRSSMWLSGFMPMIGADGSAPGKGWVMDSATSRRPRREPPRPERPTPRRSVPRVSRGRGTCVPLPTAPPARVGPVRGSQPRGA